VTLNDDIQAVLNRGGLKPEEKRRAVDQIKGNALKAHADALVGKEFVEGDLRITILYPPEVSDNRISLWVSAKRGDQPIEFAPGAMPLVFVNPPINVRAADGSPVENPLSALRGMVADVVSRLG